MIVLEMNDRLEELIVYVDCYQELSTSARKCSYIQVVDYEYNEFFESGLTFNLCRCR